MIKEGAVIFLVENLFNIHLKLTKFFKIVKKKGKETEKVLKRLLLTNFELPKGLKIDGLPKRTSNTSPFLSLLSFLFLSSVNLNSTLEEWCHAWKIVWDFSFLAHFPFGLMFLKTIFAFSRVVFMTYLWIIFWHKFFFYFFVNPWKSFFWCAIQSIF